VTREIITISSSIPCLARGCILGTLPELRRVQSYSMWMGMKRTYIGPMKEASMDREHSGDEIHALIVRRVLCHLCLLLHGCIAAANQGVPLL
jgi:hypothetical protein